MITLNIENEKVEEIFLNEFHSNKEKFFEFIENSFSNFNKHSLELTSAQKKELDARVDSYHQNREIGRPWNAIKSDVKVPN